jgi:ribonucleotide monophosphatase NagD (HAD superfamily)
VRPLLEEAGCTARECVMVGDRLYTDIRMAEENNLRSLLVLTGEADRAALQGSPWKPDAVVAELRELVSR